ncbi:unnamed protein product [Symbiodinium microadriaticum]|nr:unnamed protein product [Symbiodinium microadriaticum]
MSSFVCDAVGREWERVEDENEDRSSTTTVLPSAMQPPGAGVVRSEHWSPSVNGSLEGQELWKGTPTRRPSSWNGEVTSAPEGLEHEAQSHGSWEWQEQEWSHYSWESDPWASHLDSAPPGWRRPYSNWESQSYDEEKAQTPSDEHVPFPRLLSRRENSPAEEDKQVVTPRRAQIFGGLGDLPHMILPPPVVTFEVVAFYLILRKCHATKVIEMKYGIRGKSHTSSKNGEFYMISSEDINQIKKPGESWKDYWRSVEFWLASQGANLPPEVRASRLMQQLKDRAGKIVNHLSVAEVTGPDGVEEVDKKRQKFMRLGRYPNESLESFINRASIYRHENDACQNYRVGTKFYLGHLMDAARLTRKDEALIKTASGGLHDEGRVINAMLELSEQLEGLPGYPIGRGEPDLPDEDRYLVQKDKDSGERHHRRDERGRRPFRNTRGGRDRRGRWVGRMKKLKQVFHAILEDNEDRAERRGGPRRVWICYRSKLKGVPLEYVRLAALEQVESSKVCQQALQEVEKELQGGRPKVEEMVEPEVANPDPPVLEFSAQTSQLRWNLLRHHIWMTSRPSYIETIVLFFGFPKLVNLRRRGSALMLDLAQQPLPQPAQGQGILHASSKWELESAMRLQRHMLTEARGTKWEVPAAETGRLTEEIAQAMNQLQVSPPQKEMEQPVTGKPRLEYKWNKLEPAWKEAFIKPLKEAIDVYIDNQAVEPVPMGQMVPPDNILPSRFVLTNKSEEQVLEKARLKARWVLEGHLDKEAGKYATEAPTASLVAHNIVCFISAQCGWTWPNVCLNVWEEEWPEEFVRLTKGGFGLSDSPRLWYLRLRRGLVDVGLKELKLSRGTFVFHHQGEMRGVVAVHVDDFRISFDPKFDYFLNKLRETFSFGDWKMALNETVKFCGRWERQCPKTFQVTVTMDGYAHKLLDPPQRAQGDRQPLTDAEKKWVASVGGKGGLIWPSDYPKVQQMAGARDPETLKSLLQLVKKAHEPYHCVFQAIPGGFDKMIFLAVAAMPKGRSQGGMMIMNASEDILDGDAQVNCLLYHSAVLKRVVCSSLAAEISQAAEALEQCDCVRAMMAEIVDVNFKLNLFMERELVDKRLAIDIAILKESLYEPNSNRWVRWVPGMTVPSDGFTKEYGNPMRDAVMQGGQWSLRDSPEAQKLREEAGHRKRQCRDRVRIREQEFEVVCQAADIELNRTAVRKIIKKFDKRFHVRFHEVISIPDSPNLMIDASAISTWLLAPALQCLRLIKTWSGGPQPGDFVERPLRQFSFWAEELRAGAAIARCQIAGGPCATPTDLRLQLICGQDLQCRVRNTFIHVSSNKGGSRLRSHSLPSRLAQREEELNEALPLPPELPVITLEHAMCDRFELQPIPRQLPATCALDYEEQETEADEIQRWEYSTGTYYQHNFYQGADFAVVPDCKAAATILSSPSTMSEVMITTKDSSSTLDHSPKGKGRGKSLQSTASGSRWWMESPEVCPICHFPIRLLPYPPFKLQVAGCDAREPAKLVDGPFMVLQVLSTWNFDVLGHELTVSDIKALDSYMKRCKLGPFRLGRALELLSDPSHEAREELESLRSKARRRLEGLKHIQRVRMNRMDMNPDDEGEETIASPPAVTAETSVRKSRAPRGQAWRHGGSAYPQAKNAARSFGRR